MFSNVLRLFKNNKTNYKVRAFLKQKLNLLTKPVFMNTYYTIGMIAFV